MKYKILFIAFAFSLLISCKKKEFVLPDLGYNYFPIRVGNYYEYDVDSIFYNSFFQIIDTTSFQLRDVYESNFIDLQQRPSVRVERYRRYSSSDNWQIEKVYYITRNEDRAEVNLDNNRYVKIVFPLRFATRWNINLFNTFGERIMNVEGRDVPGSMRANAFDSTLTVRYNQQANLTFIDRYEERYAKNVGLYYLEDVKLATELNGTPTNGFRYFMRLNSYGKL
jgi:hypothetical protein